MQTLLARSGLLALCLAGLPWIPLSGETVGPTRWVELSGTLEVYQEDYFESGTTRRIHRLRESSTGRVYRIRFRGTPETPLVSGASATLRGRLVDDATIELAGDAAIALDPQSVRSVSGDRHTLIVVVDFRDVPVSCPNKVIRDTMFTGTNSVDGLYNETSFGAVSFPSDTDGDGSTDLVRVKTSLTRKSFCDPVAWAEEADAAAQGAGFDLGLYEHRLYVLPSAAKCGWAGLANLGCDPWCRAWVKFCDLDDIYAHELGHNLNLRHASTDSDNDGMVDCEYCDTSDFMGYSAVGWRQINGPHKFQMGWLPPSQVVDLTGGEARLHVLAPLEVDPAAAAYPQLLRMPAPGGDYYYLSYRRQIGYDATLGVEYLDRTAVHGSSMDGTGNSRLIVSLADAERFIDGAGVEVTQVSHDATSVTLLVENANLACQDGDGDGYGFPGDPTCPAGGDADCDDGDPATNPGAVEACNGVDDDCDGQADEPHFGSLPDGTLFAAICTQTFERTRPRPHSRVSGFRDRRGPE